MHADIVAALRSPGVGAAIALYVDFVAFARGATLPALDLLPVLQYLRERGNASRDAARERFGLPALAAASAIDASPRPPAVPISESATTAGELPGPAEEPAIVWDMDASELAAGAAPGDDPSAAALEIDWDVSDAPTVDGDAAGASAVAAPGADDVGWAIEVEDAGAGVGSTALDDDAVRSLLLSDILEVRAGGRRRGQHAHRAHLGSSTCS